MTQQSTSTNKPAYNIFARRKTDDGENRLGGQVGVAFTHGTGGGFTICMDAVPIPFDGKLELVAFPVKEKSDQDTQE